MLGVQERARAPETATQSANAVGQIVRTCVRLSAAATRFRETLTTARLGAVLAAAAELLRVGLNDALEILALLAESGGPRFQRAAVRWLGRPLLETPATLRDARFAVVLVERLPQGLATLHPLGASVARGAQRHGRRGQGPEGPGVSPVTACAAG
jgi:hypothetical protein